MSVETPINLTAKQRELLEELHDTLNHKTHAPKREGWFDSVRSLMNEVLMVSIVIAGASGRMGRALIEATIETIDAELIGGTVRSSSSLIGADAGELVGKKD